MASRKFTAFWKFVPKECMEKLKRQEWLAKTNNQNYWEVFVLLIYVLIHKFIKNWNSALGYI